MELGQNSPADVDLLLYMADGVLSVFPESSEASTAPISMPRAKSRFKLLMEVGMELSIDRTWHSSIQETARSRLPKVDANYPK
jgi:hypothetical protein